MFRVACRSESCAGESPSGSRKRWPSLIALTLVLGVSAWLIFGEGPISGESDSGGNRSVRQGQSPVNAKLDPDRAYKYLQRICDIGPRFSGSPGMLEQQKLLARHFEQFEADFRYQPFDAAHPLTGEPVRMNNIIISWHPEAAERVLLCCHYDTRPKPDQEFLPRNRNKDFIGANDGASGVALFMELAHHMAGLKPTFGVDFVLFDGEELVYDKQGTYFLGSEYFARDYRARPPAHRYHYGVLVDMIADRNLAIYYEKNSLKYAPDLTRSIWDTAKRLGIREFVPRAKFEIQDDHLPLNEIARIPTCDIIDFDYPHWHTIRDEPKNCSGESLEKVGRVLLQWLTEVPHPR